MTPTSFSAPSDAIDIWLTPYQEITDPRRLAAMHALLSDAERRQEGQFRFADDRLRYLVTRALVRVTLSRYAATAPGEWVFRANTYGRPEIVSADPQARRLRFNISHTRGLIALAVSWERELGIDVEYLAGRPAPLSVAGHAFSPAEAAQLNAVAPQHQHMRFFEYWTLKESYIKARGMGLSLPLDAFSFHFPGGDRISLEAAPGDDARRWAFWQCRPAPDHLLALCAEVQDALPRLRVYRAAPDTDAHPFAVTWLKTSV